jgi:hypothetical protein
LMSKGSSDSKMDAFSCNSAQQPNHERSQESAIKCVKSRAQHSTCNLQ